MVLKKYLFITIFINITLIHQIGSVVQPPYKYSYPILTYQFTYTKKYQSDFTQLLRFQTRGCTIYELYYNNTFVVTDAGVSNPYQRLFFNPSNPTSMEQTSTLIDFSVQGWMYWQVNFLLSDNRIISYDPYTRFQYPDVVNVDSQLVKMNSVLQNTNQTFYIFNANETENGTAVFYRFLREQKITANISGIIPSQTVTNIQGQVRAKVCKKIWQTTQYAVIWNSSSYIEMYQCNYDDCTLYNTINDLTQKGLYNDAQTDNQSWVTDNIIFGGNCGRFYVEYDGWLPAMTYRMNGNNMSYYEVNDTIPSFTQLGAYDHQSTILFPNGSLVFFSNDNNTYMTQYDNLGNYTQYSRFVWANRKLLMNYQDKIVIYKMLCWDMVYWNYGRGQCYNCSITCTSCNEGSGQCYTCIFDYEVDPLNNKQCIPIVHNLTIVPTLVPTPNLVPAPLQQQGYAYGAYYYYEYQSAQIALSGFQFIGQILQKMFNLLQVLPLAWIFLNFMNFWTICSFYVFLDVDIPEYLYLILKIIYDKVNTPILQVDDTAAQIYPFTQKFQYLNTEFGISSSFLVMNLQSIILFTSCTIMTGLFIYFLGFLPHDCWFYKKISKQVHFDEIVTNQFISYASNYFLPLSLIMNYLVRQNGTQTTNLILHIIFVGMALIFPFLIFSKVFKLKNLLFKSTKKLVETERKKIQRQTFKTIQWIYYSNCNTLIPFLCLLGAPSLFLFVGIPFLSCGVWIAYHSQKFRINEVILALYRLTFHIFFAIASTFGHFSIHLKHNCSLVCVLLLFIGAIHQLLTVFISILYFFYSQIKKVWLNARKVNDEKSLWQKQEYINFQQKKIKTRQKSINFPHVTRVTNIMDKDIQQEETRKTFLFKTRFKKKLNLTQFKRKKVDISISQQQKDISKQNKVTFGNSQTVQNAKTMTQIPRNKFLKKIKVHKRKQIANQIKFTITMVDNTSQF